MIIRTLRFFSSGALRQRAWWPVGLCSVCLVSLLPAASDSSQDLASYAFFERMGAEAPRLAGADALPVQDFIFEPIAALDAGTAEGATEALADAENISAVIEAPLAEVAAAEESDLVVAEEPELLAVELPVEPLAEVEVAEESEPVVVEEPELLAAELPAELPAEETEPVELVEPIEPAEEIELEAAAVEEPAALAVVDSDADSEESEPAVAPQRVEEAHAAAESHTTPEPAAPAADVESLLDGLLQGLEPDALGGGEAPIESAQVPHQTSESAGHHAADHHGADHHGADPHGEAVAPIDPTTLLPPEPRYMQRALALYHALDFQQAIPAFVAVLNLSDLSEATEKRAMIYLARIYYQTEVYVRCVSLLQQYVDRFPDTEEKGEITFQIGLLYREMGLHDAGITAFYSVLNSIIVAGDTDLGRYMELARRAQFEIARTYFELEEWELALNLFERIELFELSAADRETLAYYKIKSLLILGKRAAGLLEIESFFRLYPDSELVSELLYEKAKAQSEMKQQEAGRRTMLKLMERGGLPEDNVTAEWVRWRRSAGNYLSNFYYKRGAHATALRLYQGIVVLDSAPYWQLPIILQMAYCFDQLGQVERARESFQYVVQEVQRYRASNSGTPLPPQLNSLEERAQWWLDMVNWRADFDARRLELLPED